jgi:alkanesulfonate monooxygenase SsuD/methylene tetrahydromethanopterin reductase-like flavin-dependent oxidoreductase (luciferase family)
MQLFLSLERNRSGFDHGTHLDTVVRQSEELRAAGLLIVQHPKQLGVWATAGALLAKSSRLQPLIAVSPDHTHPVTAYREAASLAALYGRPVGLNLIAGAGTGDADTPVSQRYARFQEFVTVVARLLVAGRISYAGETYRINDAGLTIDAASRALVWAVVAGSSPQAEQAAKCGLPRVTHYTPETRANPTWAVHVGIITRPSSRAAWSRARSLFPAEGSEQTPAPDAPAWARAITTSATEVTDDHVFFPTPFLSKARPYPYLVGSYQQIREHLARLGDGGCEVLVLQRTGEVEDLRHVVEALSAPA